MCEVTTTSRRTMVALGKMIVFGTWPLVASSRMRSSLMMVPKGSYYGTDTLSTGIRYEPCGSIAIVGAISRAPGN